jgi:hypothetical protein
MVIFKIEITDMDNAAFQRNALRACIAIAKEAIKKISGRNVGNDQAFGFKLLDENGNSVGYCEYQGPKCKL